MQKKKIVFFFLFYAIAFCAMNVFGQKKSKIVNTDLLKTSPKLIVGIVVNQMRYDCLTRFWNHFSEGGFKRLVNGGFSCKNNHLNYSPTYTAPGHASIYTKSTHSSPQIYDTHVPLLFYGKGIKKGRMVERTEIFGIAPTIATLLGISFPSGTTGNPIVKLLK